MKRFPLELRKNSNFEGSESDVGSDTMSNTGNSAVKKSRHEQSGASLGRQLEQSPPKKH